MGRAFHDEHELVADGSTRRRAYRVRALGPRWGSKVSMATVSFIIAAAFSFDDLQGFYRNRIFLAELRNHGFDRRRDRVEASAAVVTRLASSRRESRRRPGAHNFILTFTPRPLNFF